MISKAELDKIKSALDRILGILEAHSIRIIEIEKKLNSNRR